MFSIVSDKSLRFVIKEAVCTQCGYEIHHEIRDGPVARVYYLSRVLEQIVFGFNDVSFAQHHPVIEWHQLISHIHP